MKKQLAALVTQIQKGRWVDENGHDLTRNVAYLDAVKALETPAILNLEDRTVGEVIQELEGLNAATAQMTGLGANDEPVFAVIFVRGTPTTAEVLELLEAYQDEDAEERETLEKAVYAAAHALADERGPVSAVQEAIQNHRAFLRRKRQEAEKLARDAADFFEEEDED
jgi:hypothetical protein